MRLLRRFAPRNDKKRGSAEAQKPEGQDFCSSALLLSFLTEGIIYLKLIWKSLWIVGTEESVEWLKVLSGLFISFFPLFFLTKRR